MKIDISNSPYYPEFKSGYVIFHNREGRRYVVLVREDQTKTCTAYARYLMAVKIGRRLLNTEQVDHIDEDKSNDSIENLQILSKRDNISKNKKRLHPPTHGGSRMYKEGCRCSKCVEYMKKL